MSCYATRGWGDGPAIQEPAPFAKGRVAAKPIRHKNVRAMFNGTQRFPTNSISNSQQADHPSLTASMAGISADRDQSQPPQRFAASSTDAVKPNKENVSLVFVPRPDWPDKIAFAPRFIAVMILESSSVVAGHAHSPSVNNSNVLPEISIETVEPDANG